MFKFIGKPRFNYLDIVTCSFVAAVDDWSVTKVSFVIVMVIVSVTIEAYAVK